MLEKSAPLSFTGGNSYLSFLKEQFDNQCFLLEQNHILNPAHLPLDQFYAKLNIVKNVNKKRTNQGIKT